MRMDVNFELHLHRSNKVLPLLKLVLGNLPHNLQMYN